MMSAKNVSMDLEKEQLVKQLRNLTELNQIIIEENTSLRSLLGLPMRGPVSATENIKTRYKKGYGTLLSN